MIFLGLMLTNSIGNLGYLLVGIGGVIFLITFIFLLFHSKSCIDVVSGFENIQEYTSSSTQFVTSISDELLASKINLDGYLRFES